MRRRLLESLIVAAVMAALVLFLQLSAAGQAPAGRATAAPTGAPRLASGQPDLQGIWLDEFDTPLERQARYADREFLTDQERADLNDARSGNAGRNQRAAVGTRQDVAGAYKTIAGIRPKFLFVRTRYLPERQ